jgi:hypothetical protein
MPCIFRAFSGAARIIFPAPADFEKKIPEIESRDNG